MRKNWNVVLPGVEWCGDLQLQLVVHAEIAALSNVGSCESVAKPLRIRVAGAVTAEAS